MQKQTIHVISKSILSLEITCKYYKRNSLLQCKIRKGILQVAQLSQLLWSQNIFHQILLNLEINNLATSVIIKEWVMLN
jgi:hypothetical protein